MQEWKIRQEIYHRLHTNHSDDLSQVVITVSRETVIEDAVRYFTTTEIGWIYPAKSYAVGICYAKWLSDHFGGCPIAYLSDPNLLYGNDPYFVPYQDDSATYDAILDMVCGWNFDQTRGLVPDMYQYFIEEFMILSNDN